MLILTNEGCGVSELEPVPSQHCEGELKAVRLYGPVWPHVRYFISV